MIVFITQSILLIAFFYVYTSFFSGRHVNGQTKMFW